MPKVEPWTLATAFGVVSLAYVFGPSISSGKDINKKSKLTVGLANRANECFINSNLQALAAVSYLEEYLELQLQNNKQVVLAPVIYELICALNEKVTSKKTLSAWPVLVALERVYRSKVSSAQHDAHEMLHLLLETLETELKPPASSPVPFSGSTVDTIVCAQCKHISHGPESAFLIYSLLLPQKRSVTLESLLAATSDPEYIGDYSCLSCRLKAASKHQNILDIKQYTPENVPEEIIAQLPTVKSAITKTTRFHRLPPVLVLHLSRSIYQGHASRNPCKVSVKEHLTVQDASYTLCALIKHKGTHQSGHYECFRRKKRASRSSAPKYAWWKVSDEVSCECTTRDVLRDESGAYILVYQRDGD